MKDEVFDLSEETKIGSVISVDTTKIFISIEDFEIMQKVCVGNIIAVQSAINHELLISLVEKVSRSINNPVELIDENEEDDSVYEPSSDIVKCVLIGTYKSVSGDKKNIFKRGSDTFPQINSECYIVDGANLQRFMNILAKDIKDSEQLKIGTFTIDPNAKAILDGDKLFQRHASILGSTGSGKSWCVASILEKANELKYPNIIVFDMHGEYKPLTEDPNRIAEYFKIAGPGDLTEEVDNSIFLPYWLLNREEMLSMFLDRSDMNAPNQASRFTLHVRNLKKKTLEENKKTDILKTYTVDSPIPYKLNELISELNADNVRKGVGSTGKPVKGEWEGKLTRFISRLQAKTEDRRYGFLFQPSVASNEYNWLSELMTNLLGIPDTKKGIKIIDFSEVPSDVLPVITGTFARLLYNIQFWQRPELRTPFTFLCDEAHLYLPIRDDANSVQKQALYNFERIAKEGRKYGVSIMVVSQRPSDVSKTILSQCNNFIVLRLTNDRDKNVVTNLMSDSLKGLTDTLPILDTGEALILGDSILLPNRVKLDQPSKKPDSATKDFWKEWSSNKPQIESIIEAVETLRMQTRPK